MNHIVYLKILKINKKVVLKFAGVNYMVYLCNRNQYYTGSPKNAKPVVTISRAEGAWQRCHPIVAVMQPRMYIYMRVGHKPFNAEWSKHRNNMKIELTDKQAQVLYYVLDRVNKCLEKDNLFGGTLYHDNGSFLCQLEPSEKRSLDRIIEKMSK